MTTDEKLAAILAAVQTDPGNRGLARDPDDNLFSKWPTDFALACRSLTEHSRPTAGIVTGFYIPTADPPAYETDGPLGAVFLARALRGLKITSLLATDPDGRAALEAGLTAAGTMSAVKELPPAPDRTAAFQRTNSYRDFWSPTHYIFVERVGPGKDSRCRTMRGRDVTEHTRPAHLLIDEVPSDSVSQLDLAHDWGANVATIGIGDGGNEIGMGKIPHETIVKNIPNGDLIHCRVPTDHLIVAGVSNWGAYALAAGVYVLRGVKPSADLFDPDREREILEVMVREGPLVDGVTGKQTATVDGLTWDEYAKPLVRIREILES
ncbi:MAG: DUF4392 domain-containing protein [Planctomycetes bacterium]|nr:DUF4392 domain-containing protein [Planctomycetota bacterium]